MCCWEMFQQGLNWAEMMAFLTAQGGYSAKLKPAPGEGVGVVAEAKIVASTELTKLRSA